MAEGQKGNEVGPLIPELSSILVAAHELKSPLVLMRQLALRANDSSVSDDERSALLHQVTQVAEQGLRVTTNLTKTARLDDAMIELEPVNIEQICHQMAKIVGPLYELYGRSLTMRVPRRKPLVLAHRDLLERLLCNFADNALHYGGDTDAVEVRVQHRLKGNMVRVGVRDYGPSLSKKEYNELKRGSSQHFTYRPQGSGLGIMIAERFAAAMNGAVGIIRHRDGVTFYVDVPVSEQLSLL